MINEKMKIFKDSVHGYIQIPETIVKYIIDTQLFQRLRCIEQTSMRILYPAARHDRFIHSLGVYYLGAKAFSSFRVKTEKNDALKFGKDWWDKHYILFSLACLLHDCAHAPFSHTYEFIYDIPRMDSNVTFKNEDFKENKITRLDFELISIYKSVEFEYDFFNRNKK